MEYNPPPFFKQGPSALARLLFFSILSIALLIIDARMKSLTVVRQWIGTVLYPVQQAVIVPRDLINNGLDYFINHNEIKQTNLGLQKEIVLAAQRLLVTQQLEAENQRLRGLLNARERVAVPSKVAEILYDTRDAFARKVVIDQGEQAGLQAGFPVIDEHGVIGQVTRIFPQVAEVTLLTDKDQSIPVEVLRNGLRSIVYGASGSTRETGLLELKFIGTNANVEVGDQLVTSGIDGLYPSGLPVARVQSIDRKADTAFARILCEPIAGVGSSKQVLVLFKEMNLPARPDPTPETKPGKIKRSLPANPSRSDNNKPDTNSGNKTPAGGPTPSAAAPRQAEPIAASPVNAGNLPSAIKPDLTTPTATTTTKSQ